MRMKNEYQLRILERLEARQCLAFSVFDGYNPIFGFRELRFDSDNNSDAITLESDGATSYLEVTWDGQTYVSRDWANEYDLITVKGNGGDDTIDASKIRAADVKPALTVYLEGGVGNDTIKGSEIGDSIYGGLPNQSNLSDGMDIVFGNKGDDDISGGTEADTLDGGADGDDIYGEWSGLLSTLDLPLAGDKIYGQAGEDRLFGGDGNDVIYGHTENDTINGEEGNDYLDSGPGHDFLQGGYGNDTIFGRSGGDLIYGDNDYLMDPVKDGADIIYGDDNPDNDMGSTGQDEIYAGGGDDKAYGGQLYDIMNGDAGKDMLEGNQDKDVVAGGDGNDKLYGEDDANSLFGGNDSLFGDDGCDDLYGGPGQDIGWGGFNLDTFAADVEDKIQGDATPCQQSSSQSDGGSQVADTVTISGRRESLVFLALLYKHKGSEGFRRYLDYQGISPDDFKPILAQVLEWEANIKEKPSSNS